MEGAATATLIVHPQGKVGLIGAEHSTPTSVITDLIAAGQSVMVIDTFLTGEHGSTPRDASDRFFTTYNRTDAALRVQDVVTALVYLRGRGDVVSINVVGMGEAGLWCLLASGFVDVERTVIDANQFDSDSDEAYLQSLPIPSIRRVGDVRTAAAQIAPHHLCVHNTGTRFKTDWISDVYEAVSASSKLALREKPLSTEGITAFLLGE